MHFYYCRICRTDKNLKYTAQQILQIVKKAAAESQQKSQQQQQPHDQLLSVTNNTTLGNICHECYEHLHNFHRLDDDDDDGHDGDTGLTANGGAGLGSGVDREELPVIVDDDELLFDLFLQKVGKQRDCNQMVKQQALSATTTASSTRSKCDNYELTQLSLGSDGDTEVIEVLTSRESTPAPQPNKYNGDAHKIIAIIDLDNDDKLEECKLTTPTKPIEHTTPSTRSGHSKRKKSYAGRELRLIASLSLVSSDSECDDFVSSNITTVTAAAPNKTVQCQDVLHDNVTKSNKSEISCPMCVHTFNTSQRLIYHIRCKHRSYDGDELSEQPRRAQDSAMTIRLRYLDRFIYYECQLCGRIDSSFKEHKQHIMESHADESRSLKDPMMQTLRCPLCKETCGTQQLAVCAHLLAVHTIKERKGYIKEVRTYQAFSCTTSKQEQIYNTARVYQYSKRKTYYFECKLCSKVAAGYVSHMQHLTSHNTPSPTHPPISKSKTVAAIRRRRDEIPKTPTNPSTQSSPEQKQQRRILRAVRKFKADGTPTSKSSRGVVRRCRNARRRPTTTTKQNMQKLAKANSNSIAANVAANHTTRIMVKSKPPLRHFPTLLYRCGWCEDVFEGFYRLNLHRLNVHHNEDLLHCNNCVRTFMSAHSFRRHDCVKRARRMQRKRRHPIDQHLNVSIDCKRLCPDTLTTTTTFADNDDVIVCGEQNQQPINNDNQHDGNDDDGDVGLPLWLSELLQVNQRLNTATETTTTAIIDKRFMASTVYAQCSYCTHLFANKLELSAHTLLHLRQKHAPIIKRL